MRDSSRVVIKLLPLLLLMVLAACSPWMVGCGSGEGGSDTANTDGKTTGDTTTTSGHQSPSLSVYKSDVSDLASHADQVNSDYADKVDDYDAGTVDVSEIIDHAEEGRREFSVMVETLAQIVPPDGLEAAHQQLVDGFGKWVRFYELQAEGLKIGGDALQQARDLDSQAGEEVNRAIAEINQAT